MIDFWNYIKHPTDTCYKKPRTIYFGYFLLIYIAFAFQIALISYIICIQFNITHNELGFSVMTTIVLGIILAPIYEEIIFRSLLKFTKYNIILFVVTLIILLTILIFRSKIISIVFLSTILSILIIILLVFSRSKIDTFISSNFKYFYYASSLAFGLLHIFNFTGNVYLLLSFSLILTGPQIFLGFILGYIRINYGLRYSILFHIIVNTSLLLSLFHN